MKSLTPIMYRAYTRQDKAQLIACVEAIQDHFISTTDGWLRRSKTFGTRYTNYLIRDVTINRGAIILAFDKTRLVGMVAGRIEAPTSLARTYYQPGERFGWIDLLFVHPKYRGKRIGRELLDRIEETLIKKGCTVIRLEAQGNIPELKSLYGKAGYKPWVLNMAKRIRKPD